MNASSVAVARFCSSFRGVTGFATREEFSVYGPEAGEFTSNAETA